MKSPILIASASLDSHAYNPVSEVLEKEGYPVVIYKTDKVLDQTDTFNVVIQSSGQLAISYNDTSISADDIGAAWYRKLNNYDQTDAKKDLSKHLYLSRELRLFHDAIWSTYPDSVWLNSPARIKSADQKLTQLSLAQRLGFSIPKTVLSNDWGVVRSEIQTDDSRKIIAKTVRGVISEGDEVKVMYSQLLDEPQIALLSGSTNPYLGIYQQPIPKFREWRVTTVEDSVFSAAIYTDESAKDDWRKHQTTPAVQFKAETLPEEIASKCVIYLGAMGLKYGAFDLIETYEGEFVFLECNPNGQYGWLETGLGFPISESIAHALIRIAQTR